MDKQNIRKKKNIKKIHNKYKEHMRNKKNKTIQEQKPKQKQNIQKIKQDIHIINIKNSTVFDNSSFHYFLLNVSPSILELYSI